MAVPFPHWLIHCPVDLLIGSLVAGVGQLPSTEFSHVSTFNMSIHYWNNVTGNEQKHNRSTLKSE